MNTSHVQQLTESVDGFLSQNGQNLFEGEVLFHLARSLPSQASAVEVGSWKGKSTIWLGKGIEASGGTDTTLYAIDPHIGSEEHQSPDKEVWTFPEFEQNIAKAKLQSIVHPLVATSVEGAKRVHNGVDFIFIDGAHDYDSVKVDFEAWFPKMKSGGVMAFHDSFVGWKGVQKLVDEEVFLSQRFKKVRYINSITYAIKADRLSLLEKVENTIAYGIKRFHMWSLRFPQSFKSLAKRLVWHPFQRRWMKILKSD